MSTGSFVAYTGADAAQRDLEVIANNIANASTNGFRRDVTIFDTLVAARLNFAAAEQTQIDLRRAEPQLTSNPLHAAISGPGFFVVEDAQGNELFTRRGDFRRDQAGFLVLPNGERVLGQSGALQIPANSRAQLQADGSLLIDGAAAGRLRIVDFADPSQLTKRGESLIAAPEGLEAQAVANASIAAGYVESSNVNIAAEIVALINATRAFEASVRSMTIQDELTELLIGSQT